MSVSSTKLQSGFVEIAFLHGCYPVVLHLSWRSPLEDGLLNVDFLFDVFVRFLLYLHCIYEASVKKVKYLIFLMNKCVFKTVSNVAYLYIYVYMYIYMYIYIYLSIYLSIYLYIYIYIYGNHKALISHVSVFGWNKIEMMLFYFSCDHLTNLFFKGTVVDTQVNPSVESLMETTILSVK